MSGHFGRFMGLDPATGMLNLPHWMAGAAAAVLVVLCLLAFSRAGREGAVGSLARVALVLIGAAVTWFVMEGAGRRGLADERRALDARAAELLVRAALPGSALACLDGNAGDAVEGACEKALFATPEATAAAVTYTAAQLALLNDMNEIATRTGDAPAMLGSLRRAAEADRFGLVAQVLAVRDGCTSQACETLSLLNDATRVSANLADHTYDLYVGRHSAAWPAATKLPVASSTSSIGVAATTTGPAGLFFPSSASIPNVSIMNNEPPTQQQPETTGATPTRQTTPTPQRRPAQTSGQATGQTLPRQQPVDLNAVMRQGPPAYAPQ